MGNWISSVLKSVMSGYLLLILFFIANQASSGYFYNWGEALVVYGTATIMYLLVAVIGWTFIGIPTHVVLCEFFSPKKRYYFYVCALLAAVLIISFGFDAVFIALFCFLNAGFFVYFIDE